MKKWLGVLLCGWVIWHGGGSHVPYWFSVDGYDSVEECMAAMRRNLVSQLRSADGQDGRVFAREAVPLTPSRGERRIVVEFRDPGNPKWQFWYQDACFPVGHDPNKS